MFMQAKLYAFETWWKISKSGMQEIEKNRKSIIKEKITYDTKSTFYWNANMVYVQQRRELSTKLL